MAVIVSKLNNRGIYCFAPVLITCKYSEIVKRKITIEDHSGYLGIGTIFVNYIC